MKAGTIIAMLCTLIPLACTTEKNYVTAPIHVILGWEGRDFDGVLACGGRAENPSDREASATIYARWCLWEGSTYITIMPDG